MMDAPTARPSFPWVDHYSIAESDAIERHRRMLSDATLIRCADETERERLAGYLARNLRQREDAA